MISQELIERPSVAFVTTASINSDFFSMYFQIKKKKKYLYNISIYVCMRVCLCVYVSPG